VATLSHAKGKTLEDISDNPEVYLPVEVGAGVAAVGAVPATTIPLPITIGKNTSGLAVILWSSIWFACAAVIDNIKINISLFIILLFIIINI
jgi:hypothetical protein